MKKIPGYSRELRFAKRLVREVGQRIRHELRVGHDFDYKTDGSTVTEVDLWINRRIIEAVQSTFPGDGVLGEEESSLSGKEHRIWVTDPLDGTFPFKSGIPTSTVLLALLVDYQPVLGVIYNPHVNQLFFAVRGHGAFIHDRHGIQPLRVQTNWKKLPGTPVGITGSINSPIFDMLSLRDALGRSQAKPNILGSSGYEMAMVGGGQFGGVLFGYPTRHDVAAAAVIVPEAGGRVTDALGRALDFREPLSGAIISNGVLHKTLVALLKPHLTINI